MAVALIVHTLRLCLSKVAMVSCRCYTRQKAITVQVIFPDMPLIES